MQIEDLEVIISSLNNRIEQDALNENEKAIAFSRISKDAKIRYNEILAIGFAKILRSKDFIEWISSSKIPDMRAIVPPETPGIILAAPIPTPFKANTTHL